MFSRTAARLLYARSNTSQSGFGYANNARIALVHRAALIAEIGLFKSVDLMELLFSRYYKVTTRA